MSIHKLEMWTANCCQLKSVRVCECETTKVFIYKTEGKARYIPLFFAPLCPAGMPCGFTYAYLPTCIFAVCVCVCCGPIRGIYRAYSRFARLKPFRIVDDGLAETHITQSTIKMDVFSCSVLFIKCSPGIMCDCGHTHTAAAHTFYVNILWLMIVADSV